MALTEWEGLVWLCLDAEPAPLLSELAERIVERFEETETFARYRVGGLTVGHTIAYDVRANWKLIVENFMECYHCAIAHPEFSRVFPTFRAGVAYQADTPAEFAEGIEAFTLSGRASRPLLPGLLEHDHRRYYGLVLRPNVFVNLLPDHVVIHTLLPLAVDRTRIVCDWLFHRPRSPGPASIRWTRSSSSTWSTARTGSSANWPSRASARAPSATAVSSPHPRPTSAPSTTSSSPAWVTCRRVRNWGSAEGRSPLPGRGVSPLRPQTSLLLPARGKGAGGMGR